MLLGMLFANSDLHLQACKGYKTTGTTVAFDGSEDHLIGKDAKEFWDELDMRSRIDRELHALEGRWHAGELKWTYEHVQ